ncbi:MAG: nitrilase family protein [Cytophagales bacterium]|jgi:predicted amidohydrolase|nr:nitrilase family protein [Cytophagales bacterium]
MNNLRVTLVQTALHWENPAANRADLEEKLRPLAGTTDLIVLPEMFTTGFTMNASAVAEPMNLTTFKWLKMMAAHTQAVVTGSYVVSEKGHYYNRLVWMRPDGTYETYDKRHLFRMAREHETYTGGTRAVFPTIGEWRFLPLICYDLRFPVWSRQAPPQPQAPPPAPPPRGGEVKSPLLGRGLGEAATADCLLYVANWPEARRHHWNTLLTARAIENLAYVIGVNRVGTDGKNIPYSGDSVAISPRGERIFHAEYQEIIQTVELDGEALRTYREQFPAYLDADAFTIL